MDCIIAALGRAPPRPELRLVASAIPALETDAFRGIKTLNVKAATRTQSAATASWDLTKPQAQSIFRTAVAPLIIVLGEIFAQIATQREFRRRIEGIRDVMRPIGNGLKLVGLDLGQSESLTKLCSAIFPGDGVELSDLIQQLEILGSGDE